MSLIRKDGRSFWYATGADPYNDKDWAKIHEDDPDSFFNFDAQNPGDDWDDAVWDDPSYAGEIEGGSAPIGGIGVGAGTVDIFKLPDVDDEETLAAQAAIAQRLDILRQAGQNIRFPADIHP